MTGICAVLALVGACIAVAFGVVRLFPAYRRCADLAATRPIRDASFVAQARAELAERDYAVSMLDQQDIGEGWS